MHEVTLDDGRDVVLVLVEAKIRSFRLPPIELVWRHGKASPGHKSLTSFYSAL